MIINKHANTDDSDPWVCVLCRKICHFGGLGDLYGPYKVDLTEPPKAPKKTANEDTKTDQSNSTDKNEASTSITQQATSHISPQHKKSKYSLLANYHLNTGTSSNIKEIWIHEDCLVWSEGVHIVGKQILKMEQVIRDSFHHNCSLCKKKGATIGCSGKRCRRKFHFICARDDPNCLLDDANFTLKCDKCLANTAANLSLSINR